MKITIKKLTAIVALTAITAVSSISFASAKDKLKPDFGHWKYSEGGFFTGPCYSHYNPEGVGETTWHSATAQNSNNEIERTVSREDWEWAEADVPWTFGKDYCYYDHD